MVSLKSAKSDKKSGNVKSVKDRKVASDTIESIFNENKSCITTSTATSPTKKRALDGDADQNNTLSNRTVSDDIRKKNKKKSFVAEESVAQESTAYGLIKSEYKNFILSPEAPVERIDAESGLPVYKAHLLKVGEGGGTALCPFDCDCCF